MRQVTKVTLGQATVPVTPGGVMTQTQPPGTLAAHENQQIARRNPSAITNI
jgi:hypothetical protein